MKRLGNTRPRDLRILWQGGDQPVADLGDWRLLAVFVVGLTGAILLSEIGRSMVKRHGDSRALDLSSLETAVLGLLALMIGFTFAMALSRFDARRDALVNEANAIGTTHLRARLLPPPLSDETSVLLRKYAQSRLVAIESIASAEGMKRALRDTDQIQTALWHKVQTFAAKDTAMVPGGILLQALNDMFGAQTVFMFALHSRVPNGVFWALYSVGAVAFLFVGYANGLSGRSIRVPIYLMAAVVSGLIVLIQDLDRPTLGFVNVTHEPLIDALRVIDANANETPLGALDEAGKSDRRH
jgi:hypothetical protein